MNKLIVGLVAGFIVLAIVNPFVVVGAGYKGVVLNWGAVSDKILDEGIHWVMPIRSSVEKLDVRVQKEEAVSSAASKDLQVISAKVALNFHLDGSKVNMLWQNIGKDFKERVIDPSIQESVKSATAKYTAEELITKRELVKEDIKNSLKIKLASDFIIVDELNIIDFDFSPDFNKAIESKVKAEQDALTSKNKLEQIKYEAEQTVATAKAQAESIRLQSDAANNEKYVALKALEVQMEYAKQWKGVFPANLTIMGNDNAAKALPLFNVNK
jgi:regulator of protease activity HflC (stomatin/prohibitin superfamily)